MKRAHRLEWFLEPRKGWPINLLDDFVTAVIRCNNRKRDAEVRLQDGAVSPRTATATYLYTLLLDRDIVARL